MSDEQKRDKPEGASASEEVTKPKSDAASEGGASDAGANVAPTAKPVDGEAAAAPMSGEPTSAPGADVTKAGGAGEPPGGYAEAQAKPEAGGESAQPGAAPAAEAAAPVDAEREAKLKAAAEARAARAAARAAQAGAEPGDAPAAEAAAPSDAEKEAKAKAAAEARAARASARGAKTAEPEGPKEPSPNQPLLDRLVAILKESEPSQVEDAFVNERGGHVPTVVIKGDNWLSAADLLKNHPELKLNYLRNVSGVDMETHMEVVYHLVSIDTKHNYAVKVRTNRETPSVPSVTGVWPTANWNEREIYDLLGIDFPGHPDMRRILMADDWVGHPLRKDYEPLDPEV